MNGFVSLFEALDRTSSTSAKTSALETYFRTAPAANAAWALHFLLGNRPKRTVKASHLRDWMSEYSGLPLWMVETCYEAVGDLAETLALLAPARETRSTIPLDQLVRERLLPLAGASPSRQRALVRQTWDELGTGEVFLWHKLITGGFRVGVAKGLVVRALARVAGVEESVMATRLAGAWEPSGPGFQRLLSGELTTDAASRPYPFFLASPLENSLRSLDPLADWMVEWKWDGVRAQMVKRPGTRLLWSRGEEVLSDAFPEVLDAARFLPDGTVLDGEVLPWKDGRPLTFSALQQRLNREHPSEALLREIPVIFLAYDLLEVDGKDLRERPLGERRARLVEVIRAAESEGANAVIPTGRLEQFDLFQPVAVAPAFDLPLKLSPLVPAETWEEVERHHGRAREGGTEGLMLKRRASAYGVGRQRGAWWKWKVDPFTCDVVLVGAQVGHGRRASLYTDYTFAAWKDGALLPVAKAYSGLTDAEIEEVDRYVKANTTGQFGPVRAVKPELVFELAFEGIADSTRHKSGIALRFPRIARWRRDKPPQEADTIEGLRRWMTAGNVVPLQPGGL